MARAVGATDSTRAPGSAATPIAEAYVLWDDIDDRWVLTAEPTEWRIAEVDGVPEVVPVEQATERVILRGDENFIL